MLVYLCAGHFVLLHHTKKQEEEKEGMCASLVYIGVGVDRGLYCGVCVRGGCVTEDVWMSEYVMLRTPSSPL